MFLPSPCPPFGPRCGLQGEKTAKLTAAANCYENGQSVGICCSGYCAALRWVNPSA
ncbi:hypothetical protein IMZ48_08195 [Candidatus Bathyarchaeota archaeon]|nr:hypothetical protein [Candidatus Bathyarchaeota archaeon]